MAGFDPDVFAEKAARVLALETRAECRHMNEATKCMLCRCDYNHCHRVLRELLYEELGLSITKPDDGAGDGIVARRWPHKLP